MSTPEILIVNAGMGNVGSIANMLRRIGIRCELSDSPDKISAADRLILPGVGAFDRGVASLRSKGLVAALTHAVLERRRPVLGICLGMQLMAEQSEEGEAEGLGWIEGDVVRFDVSRLGSGLKVPHMGWNQLSLSSQGTSLFASLPPSEWRFYFAHSYHFVTKDPSVVAAEATHGYSFPAAIRLENIMGVQFHPEKSHRFGFALLKRFAEQ